MKKIVLVAVALCAFSVPTSAQVAEWKAISVLDRPTNIRYWGGTSTNSDEEIARQGAITACEQATGRTCRRKIAVSVPVSWYLVGSLCNGEGSTGGSQDNAVAANTRAGMRLGYEDGEACRPMWILPPGCTSTKHKCAIENPVWPPED